ncbi:MAG: GAF domain-containing protein [Anaerolineae bacterium]|nr:GAF domain-containing protein [Anaerolineae bacterium]
MSQPTILIVDDKAENLYALEKLLLKLNVHVLQATSGAAALDLTLKNEFCLAIVDVQMPEMDGYELVELLRSNEGTATLPVIFVSAIYSDDYHHRRGYEAGAVDFLSKPFAPEILLSKVKIFIDLYNQRHSLQTLVQQLNTTNTVLTKRAAQMEIVNEVGRQITSILNLDALLDRIVSLIQAKFGYYCVGVWMRNEQHTGLLLKAIAGQNAEAQAGAGTYIPVEATPSIVAHACRSDDYYLTNAARDDPNYLFLDVLPETQSELTLPLTLERESPGVKETMGALDIQSAQRDAFDDDDITVLQTLADQISIAIHNARLYDVEKQRRTLAEILEETGRVLASSLDMHEVPEMILERLAQVVSYERGAILLREDTENEASVLHIIAQRGFPDDGRVGNLRVPVKKDDVFDQMATLRRPLILTDVSETPHWQQVEWLPVNHSWLGVPLIAKNHTLGMISLTRREVAAFTPDDATLAAAFAGQAAIALENARLYAQIVRFNAELETMVSERTASLQKAYEQLEILDQKKSDFIQVVSHELRTPLTLIQGYGQILLRDPRFGGDEAYLARASGIVTGALRMHEIINSMLDMIKLDNRTWKLEFQPISLPLLMESFRQSLALPLEERGQTLTIDVPMTLPNIEGDYDALAKLFDHLLVNAIKYTPDGGCIEVVARLFQPQEGISGESTVEVVVRDTGIGIAPEVQELIFTKFYTVGNVAKHSTGKTKFKGGGPGLGLAIAKGLVEAHGGRIWVESSGCDEVACPGSQFHVLLPVKQPTNVLSVTSENPSES